MRFLLFEDDKAAQFAPLTLLRPVFELRCGHFTLRERLCELLSASEWSAWIRQELAAAYREEHPVARVNEPVASAEEPTVLLNGRWLPTADTLRSLRPGTAGWSHGELAYLWPKSNVKELVTPNDLGQLSSHAKTLSAVEIIEPLLGYPWDLIHRNPEWLTHDFQSRSRAEGQALPRGVEVVGDQKQVFVHPTAKLDPFVVLDATHGPIWIDEKARVQAFTRIEGPAFIGRLSQLFRTNLREGCTIGPVCRVGGEVEESILHSHVNKYHDGFLGHSYACPWVNLGALTTNSDLKNDYSDVSVPLQGTSIKTGSKKVGSFIGDHTKTAIGSFLNTGTSVGVMCLVLPGGELLPKHVPSFSRVWHGLVEELPDGCESGIATAKQAMSRREMQLGPAMEALIRHQFAATAEERQRALQRQAR